MDFEESKNPSDQTAATRQVQQRSFHTNDHEYKKIRACVKHYADLLYLLTSEQPLSTADLVANLGTSKLKILRDLNRLIKYEIVCRTSFEQHVLYCINGEFNTLICETLDL